MKIIFLVFVSLLFSFFTQASENPYIEMSQPSDVMEIPTFKP